MATPTNEMKNGENEMKQLLEIIDQSLPNRDWAYELDARLAEIGINLAEVQPDGSDPREIVRLADGRAVWLSDESATGLARYNID